MDVVKTKLQTQNEKSNCEKISPKRLNNKIKDSSNNNPKLSFNYSKNANIDCNSNNEPKIKYKNILSTIKIIYYENGFKGFFKGIMPRVFSSAPSCAISWGTYEAVKHLLSKKN